jgi:hypothetical protein
MNHHTVISGKFFIGREVPVGKVADAEEALDIP